MNSWLCLIYLTGVGFLHAATAIEKISLPLIPDMQRADLYVLKLTAHPAAILVLSPGYNGNGRDWITKAVWQNFARDHDLDLVGVSFASEGEVLREGRGYYYPSQGSGQLLLNGIHGKFDADVPLLLYGFSGGAHFTSGFAEWKPERVLGWCAYSADWWIKPTFNSSCPPGLVACGVEDERYGASLLYFKEGRALGKPWLWLSAPLTGHRIYQPAEDFVRDYFAAILAKTPPSGQWVDVDLKTIANRKVVTEQPSLTGWLPDANLLAEWQTVHQP